MNRRLFIALVLAVAFLVVAAVPASAATATVTISSHTTDTDFNSGTLTGDISVSGSGDSASIVATAPTALNWTFTEGGSTGEKNVLGIDDSGNVYYADGDSVSKIGPTGSEIYDNGNIDDALAVDNSTEEVYGTDYSLSVDTIKLDSGSGTTWTDSNSITSQTGDEIALSIGENNRVYIANDTHVIGLSISNGAEQFVFNYTDLTNNNPLGALAADDREFGHAIYIGIDDGPNEGNLTKITTSNKAVQWNVSIDTDDFGNINALTYHEGTDSLYVGASGQSWIKKVSPADGSVDWTASVSDSSINTVDVRSDGKIAYGSNEEWGIVDSTGTEEFNQVNNGGFGNVYVAFNTDFVWVANQSGSLQKHDYAALGGGGSASGTYTSANHSVTNSVQGWTNITVPSGTMTATWEGWDGSSWTQLSTASYTTSGNKTQTWSKFDGDKVRVEVTFDADGQELHDEGVQAEVTSPVAENATASPEGSVEDPDQTLSIDISDADFPTAQGDSVDATWLVDGSQVGTDNSLTSNQTITQGVTGLSEGSHTWHVELTDDYGLTGTSDTFNIEVVNHDPVAVNATASPDGTTVEDGTTLSIDIEDGDFPNEGDSVNATWHLDGSQLGTDTGLTSNQTITIDTGALSAGSHTWNVTLEDQYGNTGASQTFTFTVDDHEPVVDNSSATPQGDITDTTPTLEIDVNDTDFADSPDPDSVTVEFFVDGSSEGTDTLNSNGTASLTTSTLSGGSHTWNVTATDEQGNAVNSQTFDIAAPGQLEIRNETNASALIDDRTVTATFYAEDGSPIAEVTTNDGTIDLQSVVTTDEPFVVVLNASDYHQRTAYVPDAFTQVYVFMLHQNESSVVNVLDVTDNTGDFPAATTVIFIQRELNTSEYQSPGSGRQWVSVSGAVLGTDGQKRATLLQWERYRIIVENQDGDQSILGEYNAETDTTKFFTIGTRTYLLTDGEQGVEWGAEYNDTDHVVFALNDPDKNVTNVDLVIHEQGNKSNEIVNTTLAGPYGELNFAEPVPDPDNDTQWVVIFEADHDGEANALGATLMAGDTVVLPTDSGIAPWVKEGLAFIAVLVTLLLGGGINRYAATLLAPMVAGVFWFIGWQSEVVTAGILALALVLGAVYFAGGAAGGRGAF